MKYICDAYNLTTFDKEPKKIEVTASSTKAAVEKLLKREEYSTGFYGFVFFLKYRIMYRAKDGEVLRRMSDRIEPTKSHRMNKRRITIPGVEHSAVIGVVNLKKTDLFKSNALVLVQLSETQTDPERGGLNLLAFLTDKQARQWGKNDRLVESHEGLDVKVETALKSGLTPETLNSFDADFLMNTKGKWSMLFKGNEFIDSQIVLKFDVLFEKEIDAIAFRLKF